MLAGQATRRGLLSFLAELSEELCLSQIIEKPTRGPNILDLVLTNNCDSVYEWEVVDSGLSDHRMIKVSFMLPGGPPPPVPESESRFRHLNFFSPDIEWSELSADLLAVQWLEAPADPDGCYQFFIEKLWECCERRVPKRNRRKGSNIPRDRRLLMRKRNKLKRRKNTVRIDQVRKIDDKIQLINDKLKMSIDTEMAREERRAVGMVKSNPKYFYA